MKGIGLNMTRALKAFLISLSIILLVGIAVLGSFLYFSNANPSGEARSIDDINQYSYETPEITTDLQDGRFVRIQFRIVTDGKKAVQEVEKRDFQIKNIIIKSISEMNEEDFTTGLTEVEELLQTNLNEVMTEGTITDVYTISKILQ